jgi:alpha-amylase
MLCVTLQMTSAGIPVIYYGEEVGRRGGAWPTNRGDMPWGGRAIAPGKGVPRDAALRAHYQRLIALRRAHPALARGTFRALATAGDLLVFAREDEVSGDAVVVAVNRGVEPAAAELPLPDLWRGQVVQEALNGATVAVLNGRFALKLPARSAQVYVTESRTRSAIAWPTSASGT